jgi:hypothetical protein
VAGKRTEEMLPVTRMTTTDASVGPMTCPDLVAPLVASKAPSSSPTVKGDTTLETFLPMKKMMAHGRGSRPDPPVLHLAFFIS